MPPYLADWAGTTVKVTESVAVTPVASAAVMVACDVPLTVGVPEITPADEMVTPLGRETPEKETGTLPESVAASVTWTGVPTAPVSVLDPVIVITFFGATVMTNDVEAVAPEVSVTVTLTVVDPAVVGVPESTPVVEDRATPAGSGVAA